MIKDCYTMNVYGDYFLYTNNMPDSKDIPSVKAYIQLKIKDYEKALELCRQIPPLDPCGYVTYYPTSHLDIHLTIVLDILRTKLDRLKEKEINGQKTWI